MDSLASWNTLFQGSYGNQELTLLYKEDILVTMLRARDQKSALLQVYKVFSAYGDSEMFAQTLPYNVILYHKHIGAGEKNTYKYLILNSDTEYVDTTTLAYNIDKKIQELNKITTSIISIIKSYDIRLISLKLSSDDAKNYFFSDPGVLKVIVNLPPAFDFATFTSVDKLILGRKNNLAITTTLENMRYTGVFGGTRDERLFAVKLICENYLIQSRTVVVFDNSNFFVSLAYPQQNLSVIKDYNLNMDAFGFPTKPIGYFDIKIPLSSVPVAAFLDIFKFTGIAMDVIKKQYSDLVTMNDLVKKIITVELNDDLTGFEKQRILSRLALISKKFDNRFGEMDLSQILETRYKHIGSSKILKIDVSDPLYSYYVLSVLKTIALNFKDELLVVIPEMPELFADNIAGKEILSVLNKNSMLYHVISAESKSDIANDELYEVEIDLISDNDAVVRYPQRDPLRLLLRPTLTSSVINFKKLDEVAQLA